MKVSIFYFLVAFAFAEDSHLSQLSPGDTEEHVAEFTKGDSPPINFNGEEMEKNFEEKVGIDNSDEFNFAEIEVVKNITDESDQEFNASDIPDELEDAFDVNEVADIKVISQEFNASDVPDELEDDFDVNEVADIKVIPQEFNASDIPDELDHDEVAENDVADIEVIEGKVVPEVVNVSDLIEGEMTEEEAEDNKVADITIINKAVEIKADETEDYHEKDYAKITVISDDRSLIEDEEYEDFEEFEEEDIQKMLAELDD